MSRARPATSSSRARGERGSASIELVVLLPALFAVMLLGVQAALYHHARTVAIAAAQEGARAAGSEHGDEGDGVAAASTFVASAGGDDVLPGTSVAAERTLTSATVTVRGRSLSVLPGWHPTITQSATVPVERLTRP